MSQRCLGLLLLLTVVKQSDVLEQASVLSHEDLVLYLETVTALSSLYKNQKLRCFTSTPEPVDDLMEDLLKVAAVDGKVGTSTINDELEKHFQAIEENEEAAEESNSPENRLPETKMNVISLLDESDSQ
jgi:hypothetical protein